jgi:hypothetical protein
MPQTLEIQYKAVVAHISTTQDEAENEARPAVTGPKTRYAVDFIIDLKDLDLKLDAEGVHHGALNLSLIVYDHYGQVATRDDRLITLDTQPDEYAEFQSSGVKVHQEIDVPKGQFWLRTGVYDQVSHRVGTLEIPLADVVVAQR